MAEQEENYTGDYKIGLSDKGRVSFNLNVKWVIAIVFSVLTFIGYLLLDEYYIEPMEEKSKRIELLESSDESKSIILENMADNIKILLDQSEKTQEFIKEYKESHNPNFDHDPILLNNNETPGH